MGFTFYCYIWGPNLYLEPGKCCKAMWIAVQPWHYWKPVVTCISHATSISSCHLHQLYQTKESKKNIPLLPNHGKSRLSENSDSWFSIARWVTSSHLCLSKPKKTIEYLIRLSTVLLLFKGEDSGNEGHKPVQRCMMVNFNMPPGPLRLLLSLSAL